MFMCGVMVRRLLTFPDAASRISIIRVAFCYCGRGRLRASHYSYNNTPTKQLQKMQPHITLKLYATLQAFMPASGEEYPISAGMTVQDLLSRINLPAEKAKLIFIDGTKAALSSRLEGGERVGIFPPVGGG